MVPNKCSQSCPRTVSPARLYLFCSEGMCFILIYQSWHSLWNVGADRNFKASSSLISSLGPKKGCDLPKIGKAVCGRPWHSNHGFPDFSWGTWFLPSCCQIRKTILERSFSLIWEALWYWEKGTGFGVWGLGFRSWFQCYNTNDSSHSS